MTDTANTATAANASVAPCNVCSEQKSSSNDHDHHNHNNKNVNAYENEMQIIQSYFTRSHFPSTPHKVIDKDHTLLEVFKKSASFYKILSYLQGCG